MPKEIAKVMMLLIGIMLIFLLSSAIVGCSAVDKATGSSFQERCAGYRVALEAVRAAPRTEARESRIRVYEALLSACLPDPKPSSNTVDTPDRGDKDAKTKQ